MANRGESFFGTVSQYRYLSLEKEGDNASVLFTYSMKRAREIRKFRSFIDIMVQRRQRNVKNSVMDVQSFFFFFVNINVLFFAVLLAVAVGFVVVQK